MDVRKKEVEIPLLDNARPMIRLETNSKYIRCLIDTGASISVWCADERFLMRHYTAEKTKYVILAHISEKNNTHE